MEGAREAYENEQMSLDPRVAKQPRGLLRLLGITATSGILPPLLVLVPFLVPSQLDMAAVLLVVTAGAQDLLALVSMILLLVWLHRVVSTLGSEKVGYSPAFAVVAWFIPLANLVLPPLILRSVWRAASPGKNSALVLLWWPFWMTMVAFGSVWLLAPALVRSFLDTVPEPEHAGSGFFIAALMLGVVFFLLCATLLGSSLNMLVCLALLRKIVRGIAEELERTTDLSVFS